MLKAVVKRLCWFPDPEVAFATLFGHARHAYWLDSSRVEWGLARFSYMGSASGPLAALIRYSLASNQLSVDSRQRSERFESDVFTFLKSELERLCVGDCDVPFGLLGGFVGYFGYELKALCGGAFVHRSTLPDAAFVFSDRLLVFDHAEQTCYLVCLVERGRERVAKEWFARVTRRLDKSPGRGRVEELRDHPAPDFRMRRSYRPYIDDILACQRYLHAGESYEPPRVQWRLVCLSASSFSEAARA